ncbi:AVAST type 1 anti-phage system protein Avs1c [Undibacterium sp. YM2]|uniref:AVAST type 1 anti-phage system protein Avs1c n=1 Tax=Undibacterium sp. YM2 TaxID=2058625 RepID=UPI00138A203F|nr:AVAST type 1 anti-phage system protein Avs1c [Undibacterium sp. YM2]
MIKPMKSPQTRAEFERRLHLLREQLRQGKMYFSSNVVRGIDGLQRVRMLPNGRIDFLSVDQSTRLQANMMVQFQEELSSPDGSADTSADED